MNVTPVKTRRITVGSLSLAELLDDSIASLDECSVVAITSKVVSLCENTVVRNDVDREQLIVQESDYHLPASSNQYGHHFTIRNNTIVGSAGIDRSNGDGHYTLWPLNPQASANTIRSHLQQRFNLKNVGVIITDSTSQPLRLGTTGISLAHSGFEALHSYIGATDLFDQPITHSRANIAGGLAAAAVLTMGEGNEQTPIAIISDIPFVTFHDHHPTAEELQEITVTLDNDLFAPFLSAVEWQPGGHLKD